MLVTMASGDPSLPRTFLAGVASAVLPDRKRRTLARRFEIDPPRWSLALGLVEMIGGTVLFLGFGLAFLRPAAVDQSLLLLENWRPELSTTHFRGLGLVNWIAWFVNPRSWPLAYLACVGTVRSLAFAITREAVAEPIVWAVLRGAEALRDRSARRARLRRLGPERPDRMVERSPDGSAFVVLSSRDKDDWTGAATIGIGDRYYRVAEITERRDGAWSAIAYRLEETHEAAIVRRLVRYDPAGATRAPERPV